MTPDCWADPLTKAERDVLAAILSAWCKRFYAAGRLVARAPACQSEAWSLTMASADMSDLHFDVTERAA